MARETKVGLIVGLGVILFVSVFVSDYLSMPKHQEALAEEDLPNYVGQTTNQTKFIPQREDETTPAAPITDSREFAAVILQDIEERQGPPQHEYVGTPPRRDAGPALTGTIDDGTPIARNPFTPGNDLVRLPRIDDTRLAQEHQLTPNRQGPGTDTLNSLSHVEIPEPELISIQPITIKHTVVAGETLTAIAQKHYDGDGNLWRSIRDANPGKVGTNGEIVQGIVLTIPKRSTQADDPTANLSERATGDSEGPQRQRVRMVTVKEGDTVSEIAAKHLGSASKYPLIMAVNTDILEKPEHLRVGMKLRIPAEQVAEVIEEANEALTNTPEQRDQQPLATTKTYTVKEGDSLYRIAQKLLGDGERFDDIYKANKDQLSSANDIRVGMKLELPAR